MKSDCKYKVALHSKLVKTLSLVSLLFFLHKREHYQITHIGHIEEAADFPIVLSGVG